MAKMTLYRLLSFLILVVLTACVHDKQSAYSQAMLFNKRAAQANAHQVFNNLHKGYTDIAMEKLELALQEAPRDPVVLDTAGYYYEKTGDLKIANHYYAKAVAVSPNSGIVKNNYGAFLCRNGRYKASIKYFLEAAAIQDTPIRRQALESAEYCNDMIETRLGDRATYAYYRRIITDRTSILGK